MFARTWWAGAAVLASVLLGLAALELGRLDASAHWNGRIAAIQSATAAQVAAALDSGAPVEARFAVAWAAGRRGEITRAVALYREVAQARPGLAAGALFNAANALLREADRVAAKGDWVGARPLFELAKETYREVLRLEPGRWDARYNLERALRMAPEEDDAGPPGPMGGESERSVTTMRAFTLGLP